MTGTVPTLKTHPDDNVSIVLTEGGLKVGAELDDGTTLVDNVPFGHKVALADIPEGGSVLRYGTVIGIARAPLARGAWVNEHRIHLPEPPSLDALPPPVAASPILPALDGYSFDGYRNADGSVGTKNLLAITTSVQCVAGVVDHVVRRIREELLPRYPNVDGVVGLNHSYGCGVAIAAPDAKVPIRTLQNLARNPNFGGEVMVIGLGCEKLRPERLLPEGAAGDDATTLFLQDLQFTGFAAMVDGILRQAEGHLERLDRRRREPCPASDLVVGVQCGGSDAFSGLTANPVVGYAADLIVAAGGTVLFSEVTEVRDAVHLLTPRAADEAVAAALAREMAWYDAYLGRGGADRSANTTPGNKAGGLSGIVEKALGSVIKSGTSRIVDVLGPGERVRRKGLNFAATPAGDFVCGTLQLAAGMNVHVFTTGRGTPYNLAECPTLKVATNSALAGRWHDLMDLDAGRVATAGATIEDCGRELFHLILETASGRRQTAADRLGIFNDLTLFNPAPVT
ncbi:galactarate dehydratase [Rhodobium orientis]|uniref:Galactarate dehydratase n=1 Tax=Rhodobium orientis TaxID=34017 RepID=A0A327JX42_9HYPH|nr:galactarate dehydratase [Rhodobium orientis]MBB4301047.1 galactarate dehydratase [Rhodobium orientis]MBK5949715.1 galactarate dehydratase [Rhodobium orientis]RAI30166.1 galactarate dehydratase [Rhodobium orientis]